MMVQYVLDSVIAYIQEVKRRNYGTNKESNNTRRLFLYTLN
jgi:hypothetical protein